MAHIDLAANLEAASATQCFMGRIMGLGLKVVGTSEQATGRKPVAVPSFPRPFLRITEMQVTPEGDGKC